jgi:hypothetical protein
MTKHSPAAIPNEVIEQKSSATSSQCAIAQKNTSQFFPVPQPIHWGFDDPADAEPHNQARMFRHVREDIVQ